MKKINPVHYKSKKMPKKGTALIVTVLLVGVVSLVAFGITKITLSELFVGTKEEEGTQAFYAALAGVEDALMRLKFYNRDEDPAHQQLPSSLEIPTGATKESQDVVRVFINKAKTAEKASKAQYLEKPNPNPNEKDYIYDLKVWYKQDCSRTCVFSDDDDKKDLGALTKDSSMVFDVSGLSSIQVAWSIDGVTNPTRAQMDNAKLWYRIFDPPSAAQFADPRGPQMQRDFFTYLASYDDNANPLGLPQFHLSAARPPKRIDLLGGRAIEFKAFTAAGQALYLEIKTSAANPSIGTPFIHIESTGYYGSAAKKIEAVVDRRSKSTLNIFDYVIYSGSGGLP